MLPRLNTLLCALIASAILLGQPVGASQASESRKRVDVGGFRLNSVLIEPAGKAELPPMVFIHGASTSLYDPMLSFRRKLEGRATLLFVDRPGHGNSDIGGRENILPDGQADAIARLMKKRGISRAIIVGHSIGGATAVALALRHPDMVAGLVLLSPAVYPWEGGIAWYYRAASAPIAGPLFSTLVVPPIGLFSIDSATREVFAPNRRPANYIGDTRALQALRPTAFRRNAEEVAALSNWAQTASPNYGEIKAPTVIIAGDADRVVSTEIHARHLARAIPGAKLIVIHNLGHKSDYVASDLAIAAIEHVAGLKVNLKSVAAIIERQLAGDGRN